MPQCHLVFGSAGNLVAGARRMPNNPPATRLPALPGKLVTGSGFLPPRQGLHGCGACVSELFPHALHQGVKTLSLRLAGGFRKSRLRLLYGGIQGKEIGMKCNLIDYIE